MNQQDEYMETQQNAPLWFFILVWLGWVIITIAGYLVGQWLSQGIAAGFLGDTAARRVLSIEGNVQAAGAVGYAVALLTGLIQGVALGVAQGLFLLPFLRREGAVEWLLATIMGRTVQWIVIYVIGLETVNLTFDKNVPGVLLLFVFLAATGLLSGAALGYPQSQVFQRRAYRATLWVIVSTIGPVVTSLVVGMTLFIEAQNTIRDYTTLLTALLSAIATGFVLMEILQHPRSEAEWLKMLTWRRGVRATLPAEDTVLGSDLYTTRTEQGRSK